MDEKEKELQLAEEKKIEENVKEYGTDKIPSITSENKRALFSKIRSFKIILPPIIAFIKSP